MSYGRMKEAEPRLALEVQSWFDQADALDGEDDREHGVERSGDELPDWIVNKEQRRQRIQAAMAQLEAEARTPDDDPEPPTGGVPQPSDEAPNDGKPADRVQLNFTDRTTLNGPRLPKKRGGAAAKRFARDTVSYRDGLLARRRNTTRHHARRIDANGDADRLRIAVVGCRGPCGERTCGETCALPPAR
ncbi:MAG: hypothetical protein ABI321_12110 [Polyangia bacterium]